MTAALPLIIKNVFTKTSKNVLLPLEVTSAASEPDASIQKQIYGLGMTALVIHCTGNTLLYIFAYYSA